jgi:hypothetical protein
VVGVGAIATNAATGQTPDWPAWLTWVPVGPVPVVVATILVGMALALVRAQRDSTFRGLHVSRSAAESFGWSIEPDVREAAAG